MNKVVKKGSITGVANANISDLFSGLTEEKEKHRKAELLYDVTIACQALLTALRIDYENDPQTQGTPLRMAKMYVNELMRGRYEPKPTLREFPNTKNLDQVYVIGPVQIRSLCSHHMVPFMGHAWLGLVPNPDGILLGLSKFSRLADWVFSRPQIQEEATCMLADEIEAATKADGIAVIVKAQHLCMSIRGVKDPEAMATTSIMRGLFRESSILRSEFLTLMRKDHA